MTLRPFQIILIGVFVSLAVAGIFFFTKFQGFSSESNPYGASVEIWGTLNAAVFANVMGAVVSDDPNFKVVTYSQRSPRTFVDELVNAIAEGRGPDAIVLPQDLLIFERTKLYPIPYETLPLRDIKNTYVDGAEIFSLSDGMYGFPFAVDPLVMYWNRDLFSTEGFASPPTTWEAVVSQTVPSLRKLKQSQAFALEQSALAFGEYLNVQNATEILLMLMLQAGSPLIIEYNGEYNVRLNQSTGQTLLQPLVASLEFYTQFANPAHPLYTWNRSLPQDRNAFLAEDLALYFGFGSEYESLRAGNPNFNYDAAPVPQGSGVSIKKSYGRFYALSILRSSDNFAGAFLALAQLGDSARALALAEGLGMAPVHRSTLALGHPDPFRQTMYSMALIARGFLDPNPSASGGVFKTMIEDVTSGRMSVSQATADATGRLGQLLP